MGDGEDLLRRPRAHARACQRRQGLVILRQAVALEGGKLLHVRDVAATDTLHCRRNLRPSHVECVIKERISRR